MIDCDCNFFDTGTYNIKKECDGGNLRTSGNIECFQELCLDWRVGYGNCKKNLIFNLS